MASLDLRPTTSATTRPLGRQTLLAVAALTLAAGCSDDNVGQTRDAEVGPDAELTDGPDATEEEAPPPFTCDEEDELTPNHTAAEAEVIGVDGVNLSDLYLCSGFDDYYVVELTAGGGVYARIDFANRLGDLDLYLYEEERLAPAEAVARSTSTRDFEELRYTSDGGGRFVLHVSGVEGASGLYDLVVRPTCRNDDDCPCGPSSDCPTLQHCVLRGRTCQTVREPRCGADAYEPNNEMSAPFVLAEVRFQGGDVGLQTRLEGTVCGDDVDYFRVAFDEVADLRLELTFDPFNDLDLAVLDEAGELVGASVNTDFPYEVLHLPRLAPGTYLVYVDTTAGGSANLPYELALSLSHSSPCTSNLDCAEAPGRGLCIGGGCAPFVPEEPSALGEICDSFDDCADENAICWIGTEGLDSNFCTGRCFQHEDCAFFEAGRCLLLFGRFGVCFDACEAESDCPVPFTCVSGQPANACERVACGVDEDCDDGRACLRTELDNSGYCRVYSEVTCAGTAPDGNGRTSDATVVVPGAGPLSGLSICDGDVDWYRVTVAEEVAQLEASVTFPVGSDLDVYVYDATGRTVASATAADANPGVAVARHLAAGEYLIRVDQYPAESGDRLTTYSLAVSVTAMSGCTEEGAECNTLVPLRIDCLESGVCAFLEGGGALPPGAYCDSSDDCSAAASVCFTGDGALNGNNICTHTCSSDDACSDIPGTVCTQISFRTRLCLPE
jgi:hypothetical protein